MKVTEYEFEQHQEMLMREKYAVYLRNFLLDDDDYLNGPRLRNELCRRVMKTSKLSRQDDGYLLEEDGRSVCAASLDHLKRLFTLTDGHREDLELRGACYFVKSGIFLALKVNEGMLAFAEKLEHRTRTLEEGNSWRPVQIGDVLLVVGQDTMTRSGGWSKKEHHMVVSGYFSPEWAAERLRYLDEIR